MKNKNIIPQEILNLLSDMNVEEVQSHIDSEEVLENWLSAWHIAMSDELNNFARNKDKFERCMEYGKYCWQECVATEHCQECSLLGNGNINYYENPSEPFYHNPK